MNSIRKAVKLWAKKIRSANEGEAGLTKASVYSLYTKNFFFFGNIYIYYLISVERDPVLQT